MLRASRRQTVFPWQDSHTTEISGCGSGEPSEHQDSTLAPSLHACSRSPKNALQCQLGDHDSAQFGRTCRETTEMCARLCIQRTSGHIFRVGERLGSGVGELFDEGLHGGEVVGDGLSSLGEIEEIGEMLG